MHRDIGFAVVGLTFVYAVSGIAVNHIEDWDPSFTQVDDVRALPGDLPADDAALAATTLSALGIDEAPRDVYRIDGARLDVTLEHVTVHVDTARGEARVEGQEPRFLLRVANWLHVARGKPAWTVVADAYAVLLLVLATTGVLMLAGRKGLLGRGGVLLLLGVALPVVYVAWSGGP
jgi:hypothetical protein